MVLWSTFFSLQLVSLMAVSVGSLVSRPNYSSPDKRSFSSGRMASRDLPLSHMHSFRISIMSTCIFLCVTKIPFREWAGQQFHNINTVVHMLFILQVSPDVLQGLYYISQGICNSISLICRLSLSLSLWTYYVTWPATWKGTILGFFVNIEVLTQMDIVFSV